MLGKNCKAVKFNEREEISQKFEFYCGTFEIPTGHECGEMSLLSKDLLRITKAAERIDSWVSNYYAWKNIEDLKHDLKYLNVFMPNVIADTFSPDLELDEYLDEYAAVVSAILKSERYFNALVGGEYKVREGLKYLSEYLTKDSLLSEKVNIHYVVHPRSYINEYVALVASYTYQ